MRVLDLLVRATDLRSCVLDLRVRALELRFHALNLRVRTLEVRVRALDVLVRALDLRERAARPHLLLSFPLPAAQERRTQQVRAMPEREI